MAQSLWQRHAALKKSGGGIRVHIQYHSWSDIHLKASLCLVCHVYVLSWLADWQDSQGVHGPDRTACTGEGFL
jgi:hypothetical protein